jgi:ArsR family transcriptional regulator, arsenate/arsenite/antimonite-responsive transcriptional repressor
MRTILAITKALSDPNRLRILCALAERGELCVCQVQELLALAPSSTSKHLSLLANAGLLAMRKEGRWVHYRVAEEMPEGAAAVVAWITTRAAREKAIEADRRKLDEILSCSPEELCQRQANDRRCCSSAPEIPAAAKSPRATPTS